MRARQSQSAEAVVKDIRRATRRKFMAEEKIRIVLEGLKGEASTNKATQTAQSSESDSLVIATSLL